jgi:hypothetical protein
MVNATPLIGSTVIPKGSHSHRRELKEIGKKEGNREDISLLW